MSNQDQPRNNLSYEDALHGIQSGVALDVARKNPTMSDQQLRTIKHLRVGIDSAHVSDTALFRLLLKKGIFTADEFAEELRLETNRELDRYEDRLSYEFGKPVTLR